VKIRRANNSNVKIATEIVKENINLNKNPSNRFKKPPKNKGSVM
jgi:hypothetical protein